MNISDCLLAKGMLQIAIQRMAKEHPFHANLLPPDGLLCDPEVKTMGVTIRGGRLQFFYAPDFVLGCSYDELIGIFQHEVNHLLFDHVLAGPEKYPDTEARIVAEEVTVNEWVTAPLPGRPLTLDQYPELRPFDNTDSRYAYLARKGADPGQETTPEGRKTGSSVPNSGPCGPKSDPPGRESSPIGLPSSLGSSAPNGAATLDNHDVWCEARANPVIGRLVVATAVQKARQSLDPSQWDSLPSGLREQIDGWAAGQSAGAETKNLPGHPWAELLIGANSCAIRCSVRHAAPHLSPAP